MAMYVGLLSAVLDTDGPTAFATGELLSLARTHRSRMLASAQDPHPSADWSLAYDVIYDSALIRLSAAVGIEAAPALFGQPRDERARLELALAEAGVDLTDAGPSAFPMSD
jgi:hypothetical protein